ncbi:MAG: anti-virulence regulator CigR family protein [Gemmatimonadales bacterium]
MNRTARISILAVAAALVLVPALLAQGGREREKARQREAPGGQAQGVSVSVNLFTDEEKRLIRDWYGQAKIQGKPLPPGIAKNLARGKPLPPGIAKQVIPAELDRILPPRPDFERLVVGTDIVLVRSGLVVDILVGVML